MIKDTSKSIYHDPDTLVTIATAIGKHPRCLKYTAERLARSLDIDLREK